MLWMKYKIDWTNRESMHNWVETLDLTCKYVPLITFLGVSKTTINYMAHSFFIGQILGSVGLARIPDLFGRKWPIVYALAA